MYPKLWQHSGLSYGMLLDKLIALAFDRREKKESLRTVFCEFKDEVRKIK
jgi:D-alanine-D-alanine ligase